MKLFTHKELVDVAFKWANGRHAVVVKERAEGWEIPDVVGLNLSNSTLIECKTSRSDFFADKKKYSRRNDDMIGTYRVYCVPKGLLKEEDLPLGWGLLEVYPTGYCRLKRNIYNKYSNRHELKVNGFKGERHILFAVLRDMNIIGLNHKIAINI